MSDRMLSVLLGTILANSTVILEVLSYNSSLPGDAIRAITQALDTSDKMLTMLMSDVGGQTNE